ncbi:DUF6911 family protein [Pseudomonas alabamensis]|uniref:DUF6911 family protein n=1 Tax=Pseudomonas alabamensis TaxID=3064349 RepID=UPI003F654344
MGKYSLSWVIGVGDQAHGGHNNFPDWRDIEHYLDKIKKNGGSLTLSIVDGPDIGPQLLQVLSDNGRYILSLGVNDGLDYVMRSYYNPALKGTEYEILGNLWRGELVCLDLAIVKEAFSAFFLTGDVSLKLLS